MPVTNVGAAPPGTEPAAAPVPQAPPAPGFDRALAGQLTDPRNLPTVSMSEMVAALAGGGPGLLAPGSAGLGGLGGPGLAGIGAASAAGGLSDDWGAAADRPASALHGPGAQVLSAGERYLGVPYKWGGTSAETGFDCSGFVQRVYADLGIRLPRVSIDQSRAGVEVPGGLANAQPGDLVFWRGTGSRPNHIGIYAGEGRMLVAPRTGDVVRYQEITRTPDAVRRVI